MTISLAKYTYTSRRFTNVYNEINIFCKLIPGIFGQQQAIINPADVASFRNHGNDRGVTAVNIPASVGLPAKGLCRDGWTPGSILDLSGREIPLCLKINSEARSWHEAKSECRKDYGFLLKLDSAVKIQNHDLLSHAYANGKKKLKMMLIYIITCIRLDKEICYVINLKKPLFISSKMSEFRRLNISEIVTNYNVDSFSIANRPPRQAHCF